ncbi:hypothetical protein PSTT_16419, partial [Puccinia striiformis]
RLLLFVKIDTPTKGQRSYEEQRPSKAYLLLKEYWTYSCLKHPKYCHGTSSKPRTVFAITIKKDYFEDNHTAPSNVTELLNHSTLTVKLPWISWHSKRAAHTPRTTVKSPSCSQIGCVAHD